MTRKIKTKEGFSPRGNDAGTRSAFATGLTLFCCFQSWKRNFCTNGWSFVGVGFYLVPILAFVLSAGFLRAPADFSDENSGCVCPLSGLVSFSLFSPMKAVGSENADRSAMDVFDMYISIVILRPVSSSRSLLCLKRRSGHIARYMVEGTP